MTFEFQVKARSHSAMHKLLPVFTRPMTQTELAAASGLTRDKVSAMLKKLTTATPRQAYISAWTIAKSGREQAVAIYSPGPGDDAPCEMKTRALRVEPKQGLRREPDPLDWGAYRAKPRDRRPLRDPISFALYGAAPR